jgi:hypothetical protein
LTNNAFSYDLARAVQNGSLGDFNFRPTWLPDPIPNVGNNIAQEGMLKNIYGRADADTWQDFQQDYGTTPPTYDFGQSPSGTIVH